ncbi:MAG: YebC/PmpR family DNA-binding transcriptional regulator [Thermotogae bacterium]|nr:YebC/PmpR family DNA-binding transcriptional regulator [Thermotogota bacterium]
MSGHSKWANIKYRKSAQDAKRSKVFTRIIREIVIAAREGGGDASSNPRLRAVLDKAKEANMPKDTVERAIKRGTGELEGVEITETIYEGYGPGGVAMFIHAVTDNKNRTTAAIRHLMAKYNGSLAESGSVSWLFEKKGHVVVSKSEVKDSDEFMLKVIDAGAEDVNEDDEVYDIYCQPSDLSKVVQAINEMEYTISSSDLTYMPKNTVKLSGKDAERFLHLLNVIEDNDDVQEVYSNFEIDDKEMEEIMSRME